jgi:hypothetical protein
MSVICKESALAADDACKRAEARGEDQTLGATAMTAFGLEGVTNFGWPIVSFRPNRTFQAFLAMAGATPSADLPSFSRTRIRDYLETFVDRQAKV